MAVGWAGGAPPRRQTMTLRNTRSWALAWYSRGGARCLYMYLGGVTRVCVCVCVPRVHPHAELPSPALARAGGYFSWRPR